MQCSEDAIRVEIHSENLLGLSHLNIHLDKSSIVSATPPGLAELLSENPFVRFHNAQRGYIRCIVNSREWRSDYQVVEFVDRPGAPLVTRASFVVEDGTPGAKAV